ncbi:unnamed protein product [Brassica rapa]|uniref:Uncharacterized protein n=1 Tax=Brassica campestris TaxID=3711 RepID=A0A3P5YFR4_BRACM|nr:unnamed protein product [Brassica rapa]VDC60183.1 unnamed protein product [Brassica rapa]
MKHKETGGSCIRRTFKNNGKLKVASSDRVSNASTNSAAGVKPENTDSRKEFRGGRSAGGRQESRLFCTDSETETDLLLAVPVSIFAGSTTAKDLKRFCTYRNSSVCSPTVRIILPSKQ